ncbi:MAG: hypothetical protein QGG88_05540 [Gammaproteobacteria bacterium]|jgi:hypothetical protein|nr:hypothetical protein [Gammaproteobacteria bacterium]
MKIPNIWLQTGLVILVTLGLLSGCVLTKVVTVPMRVVGAVASAVPVVGDMVDETIEEVADGVDELPL